jgi:hypothetical protein
MFCSLLKPAGWLPTFVGLSFADRNKTHIQDPDDDDENPNDDDYVLQQQ